MSDDAALDRAVDELMEMLRAERALIGDGPALRARLATLSDDACRGIADHGRAIWTHEVTTGGDIDRAQGAALVARALYGAIGDEVESLRAGFDFLQSRFMIADDLAAYARVRQQLAIVGARAAELQVADLAFSATVAAADCTYFALGGSGAGAERAGIVDALVDDLLIACEALRRCEECRAERPAAYQRFASLAAAAYEVIEQIGSELATRQAWLPDADAEESLAARLRGLAAATEALVPDDFTIDGGPAGRSAHIAGTLARLSSEHGSAPRARSRLRASLRDG